jgi:hypothetical protein
MDTFLVLQMFTSYSSLLSSLTNRYQQCVVEGRGGLVTNLTNLWYNYDLPKKNIIGYPKQKTDAMVSNLSSMTQQISSSILPASTDIQEWMFTEPILDQSPNSTFIKDLDCRVLGMDIDNSVNIFCSAGIVYIYNLRFVYSAIAVAMFLACIFALCLTRKPGPQRRPYN